MRRLIMKHKKYLLFVLSIIAIGILLGIIYYYFLGNDTQEAVISTISNFNNFRYNAIIKDLTVMSLLLISSFFIIGIPLNIFYLFYESLSLGFLFNIFYITFKFKGIIYILLYIIINKLLTFILIIFFVRKCIRISRYIIGLIIYRKDATIKDKIITNFKSNLYLIVYVFIINIILYFISPYIFNGLAFLLK